MKHPAKTSPGRTLMLAAGFVASIMVMAGCGAANQSSSPAEGSAPAGDKTLTVGVPVGMPYVGFETGKITGLDGDLISLAAKNLGYTVKGEVVDFPGMLAGVQSDRYDVGVVTHELSFPENVSDTVAFIDAGLLVEIGPPGQVIHHPREKRTREFLEPFSASTPEENP